ncbi:cytochrome b/b6 domain-containing protein [Sphingobium tyrosinilyticum]|uniref:Cytochrome b/b6 domain-containing protein n=1 Tax=Sphingobium tyrosinilyticum TaxID=2715436 RepID=A0ABV9F535_9SPHN
MEGEDRQAPVKSKMWDAPVRIVHWALVVLIVMSWLSHPDHMDWHRVTGYAILGMLSFRVIWGFVGSSNARFSDFLAGPCATFAYLRDMPRRSHKSLPSHNPLGGWSVVLILLTLTGQVLSGLFAVDIDGLQSGPLSTNVDFDTGRWFAQMHALCFQSLQILILLHVAAVLFYFIHKRANLVSPMITGNSHFQADPDIRFAGPGRFLMAAMIAGAIAWFASRGFGLS